MNSPIRHPLQHARSWIILSIHLLSLLPLSAQTPFYRATVTNFRDNYKGVMGGEFTVGPADLAVTQLGWVDADQNQHLIEAHPVGIWEIANRSGVTSGTLVGSATVPAGSEGTFIDGFKWISLETPLTLRAGRHYVVAGYTNNGTDKFGTLSNPGPITYPEAGHFAARKDGRWLASGSSAVLTFPNGNPSLHRPPSQYRTGNWTRDFNSSFQPELDPSVLQGSTNIMIAANFRYEIAPKPEILEFSSAANPSQPGVLTLSWATEHATQITLNHGIGDVTSLTGPDGRGTVAISHNTDTIYRLEVSGQGWMPETRSLLVRNNRATPPNVVIIMADDMGWTDWQQNGQSTGSRLYETPGLNRLATSGTQFRHGLSACPVCSPTRAALLTGVSPSRLRLTDWITGYGDAGKPLAEPSWIKKLELSHETLAEWLKSWGYSTAHVGKWHLGSTEPESDPLQHGFEVNIGGNANGTVPSSYFADANGSFNLPGLGSGSSAPGAYLTDILTDHSVRLIRDAAKSKRPLYLNLWHYAPHLPFQAPAITVSKYQTKLASPPPGGFNGHGNATYAAMIEHLDRSVGRILDALDDPNGDGQSNDSIRANTWVIFTSDNGGIFPNKPLRSGKGNCYEGGVRVPFLVSPPASYPSPSPLSDNPVITQDITKTLVTEIGGTFASALPTEGANLGPFLAGGAFPPRSIPVLVHYPHYSGQGGTPHTWVRDGSWKLIFQYTTQTWELYNLATDPGEALNLASSETAKLSSMRLIMRDELIRNAVQYPTNRATGIIVTPPDIPIGGSTDAPDPILPEVPTIGASPSTVTIRMLALPGRRYVLQSSDSLAANSWLDVQQLGPVTSSQEIGYQVNRSSSETRHFYRIKILDP